MTFLLPIAWQRRRSLHKRLSQRRVMARRKYLKWMMATTLMIRMIWMGLRTNSKQIFCDMGYLKTWQCNRPQHTSTRIDNLFVTI